MPSRPEHTAGALPRANAGAAASERDSIVPIDLQTLKPFEAEWRKLEDRADSFCQSFDYARVAVANAEKLGKKCFLVTVRDDGALSGVWGLTLTRGFHSVLRPFSCGTNEEYSWPLVDHPGAVARILREATGLAGAADRLTIYNAPQGSALDLAAAQLSFRQKAQSIDGCFIPSARFASWAAVEKALPRKQRYDLRKGFERLSEQGALAIGWCETVEAADEILAFLFDRKTAWLAEKGKNSPWVGKSEVPNFFEQLVRETENPLIAAIRLNGAPIAAGICYVGATSVEYQIVTYDPRYAACSPGKLITRFFAEWAIDRGLDFDFRMVLADWKVRWAVEFRTFTTRNVMLTRRGAVASPDEAIKMAKTRLGRGRRWLLAKLRTPPEMGNSSPRPDDL